VKVQELDLNKIKIQNNVRSINEEDLQELMGSIKREGLINPITVSKVNGHCVIVAGHRRFFAVKKLGWATITCNVLKKMTALDTGVMQLNENVQRGNMSSYQLGAAIMKLMDSDKLTVGEISERLSLNIARVKGAIDVARRLPPEARSSIKVSMPNMKIKKGEISQTVASRILRMRQDGTIRTAGVKELLKFCQDSDSIGLRRIDSIRAKISNGSSVTHAIKSESETHYYTIGVQLKNSDMKKLKKKYTQRKMKDMVASALTHKFKVKFA